MRRSSAINEILDKCKGGGFNKKPKTRTIGISRHMGRQNWSNLHSLDQKGSNCVKNGLLTNISEHKAARKAFCQDGICKSLESSTFLSLSTKQLAFWLAEAVLNTLFKVLSELFDSLKIQQKDACH